MTRTTAQAIDIYGDQGFLTRIEGVVAVAITDRDYLTLDGEAGRLAVFATTAWSYYLVPQLATV